MQSRVAVCAAAILTWAALAGAPPRACAIPSFAHQYGLTCQKCHTVIPRLNEFGASFMDHGYDLPQTTPQRVFPVSAKINFAYSSAVDPSGLPKAIVDEVEVFLAGKASARTSYFIEQYLIDGGTPGATREAWFANRFTPDDAKLPVYVRAGSFGLPLPVDPETFRESSQHYTVFDQRVGFNAFNFFDPKIGVEVRAGAADHGLSARLLALQGHDRQSGVPARGTDTMSFLQQTLGPWALSVYRYDGSRPAGAVADRFWRQGYGIIYARGRWESDTVLQTGSDSSIDASGRGARSSGGFTQVRYEFNRRLFGLTRYEGTSDASAGRTRDLVTLLGYRVSRNARFTLEDVAAQTAVASRTLNLQYTVGF